MNLPPTDDTRDSPGLPPLGPGPLYTSFKRHLSDRIFYVVPVLMWLALAIRYGSLTLPTAANPAMEVGGLWGESKRQGLHLFGAGAARWVAPWIALGPRPEAPDAALAQARAALAAGGIDFPIVAKPDRGYQGWGVRRLDDAAALRAYLAGVPSDMPLLLQAYVTFGGEAGVFYVRDPGAPRGHIASMAFCYAPHVVGDGASTLAALVEADPVLRANRAIYQARNPDLWTSTVPRGRTQVLTDTRSARLGTVYRDGAACVTPALEAVVESIAHAVPHFHFGRLDIRFRSLAALQRGEGFFIVELNGAGAEMLHLWDGRMRLGAAYATLWRQYRTLFAIGAAMRRAGYRPAGVATMLRFQRRQEQLRRRYPTSS